METEETRSSDKTSKKGGKRMKALTAEQEARRREELKEQLRERLELERRALKVVERLLEDSVAPDFLVDCAKFISPANYRDAVEERSLAKLCGYPLCANQLGKIPTQQFKISTKTNRVYDITERKLFCCNFCYKASKEFELQISKTPLWLRLHDSPQEIRLLKKGDGGSSGEEVMLSGRPLREEEIENPLASAHDEASSSQQSCDGPVSGSGSGHGSGSGGDGSDGEQGQRKPRVHWDDLPKGSNEDNKGKGGMIDMRKKLMMEGCEDETERHQSQTKEQEEEIRLQIEVKELPKRHTRRAVKGETEMFEDRRMEEATAHMKACSLSEMIVLPEDTPTQTEPQTSRPSPPVIESKHPPSSALTLSRQDCFREASSEQASFREASSEHPSFREASSEQASFKEASSEHPSFREASSEHPSFREASSEHPSFREASSEQASFREASSEHPSFREASSEHPSFREASSEHPSFREASSEHPSFREASSEQASFREASSEHPSFREASSEHPSFREASSEHPSLSVTQVGMSRRGAAGLRHLLKKQPAEAEAAKLNILEGLRRTLKEWCTDETMKFLYGMDHSLASSFTDVKEETGETGEGLDEDDLEDDCEEQRRPDYETLQKESQQMELRVREFYRGTWLLPGEETEATVQDRSRKDPVLDRSRKDPVLDRSRKDPVLPLIDSHSQHVIQKKITVEKLSSCLRNIVGPLGLSMRDITTDLNNLVRTFRLTNTNITHKAPEWTLIAVVLLHLLSEVSPAVQESLQTPASLQVLDALVEELDLRDQDLLDVARGFRADTLTTAPLIRD